MRPRDLAHGIAEPGKPAPCPPSEVAGILMQQGWKDGLRHEASDSKVPVRRAMVTAESFHTLTERSVCVRELSFSSEKPSEHFPPADKGW